MIVSNHNQQTNHLPWKQIKTNFPASTCLYQLSRVVDTYETDFDIWLLFVFVLDICYVSIFQFSFSQYRNQPFTYLSIVWYGDIKNYEQKSILFVLKTATLNYVCTEKKLFNHDQMHFITIQKLVKLITVYLFSLIVNFLIFYY